MPPVPPAGAVLSTKIGVASTRNQELNTPPGTPSPSPSNAVARDVLPASSFSALSRSRMLLSASGWNVRRSSYGPSVKPPKPESSIAGS